MRTRYIGRSQHVPKELKDAIKELMELEGEYKEAKLSMDINKSKGILQEIAEARNKYDKLADKHLKDSEIPISPVVLEKSLRAVFKKRS